MIDKIKQLLKTNNFLSLAGNASASLLGVVSFAIIARTLDKTGAGSWFLFLMVFTFFDMLRSGLLLNGLIRAIAGSKTLEEENEVIGSGWQIALIVTSLSAVIITLIYYAFPSSFTAQDYQLLGSWFWLAALVSLPNVFATWVLNSKSEFKKLLWIRLTMQLIFVSILIVNAFTYKSLEVVLWAFIIGHCVSSIWVLIAGWTRVNSFSNGTKSHRKSLLAFGKYSMGTLIGSNLLRSSDTFIIRIMMGPEAVAIYNIPQKLIEIMEMPIRSFLATALPIMAKMFGHNEHKELSNTFEKNTGLLTFLIIPLAAIVFIFAEPLVVLLGGKGYEESAIILRMFAIYTAFVPLDRYSGVALDIVNKPALNMIKVVLMLLVNVVGDIIAIKWTNSVSAVAFVSILTFGSGIVFGYAFLKKHMEYSFKAIFTKGWKEFLRLKTKYLR